MIQIKCIDSGVQYQGNRHINAEEQTYSGKYRVYVKGDDIALLEEHFDDTISYQEVSKRLLEPAMEGLV